MNFDVLYCLAVPSQADTSGSYVLADRGPDNEPRCLSPHLVGAAHALVFGCVDELVIIGEHGGERRAEGMKHMLLNHQGVAPEQISILEAKSVHPESVLRILKDDLSRSRPNIQTAFGTSFHELAFFTAQFCRFGIPTELMPLPMEAFLMANPTKRSRDAWCTFLSIEFGPAAHTGCVIGEIERLGEWLRDS